MVYVAKLFPGIVPIFVAIGVELTNLLSLKAAATRKKLSPKKSMRINGIQWY